MDFSQFMDNVAANKIVLAGIKIFVILIISYFLMKIGRWGVKGIKTLIMRGGAVDSIEVERRSLTLGNAVQNIVRVVVLIMAGMMIMKEVGLDIRPLLATAGIGAVAIGFGAQSLIKDFFSGFFLITENQFRIGDVIAVNGTAGLVEEIRLRTTVLRDLEGRVHVIPNGEITKVTNYTIGWSAAVVDIGVAYKENIDRVISVTKEILQEVFEDPNWTPKIKEPPEMFGVERLGESSVDIRVRVITKPGEQWGLGRELRRRIKNRFDELGIEIPFPHRTVYLGDDVSLPIVQVG